MKLLIYIIAFFSALSVLSCRSVRYIPINSVTQIRDSVVLRDSIVAKEFINRKDSVVLRDSFVTVIDDKGNVIKTELYKQKEVYKDLQSYIDKLQRSIDELKSARTDTIREPYPVEAELTAWQKVKQEIGGFAMAGILIICAIFIYRIIKKKGGIL